ncbi:unnamed protein product [Ambrosiozyma monospora]|uniref:Unnamed protein product n=1 Tax=Ambrosiozyma monospora TaxID=43982 RepID=A0ACB5ST06_AMBMO|nr:unnamed protein product [Ambrosiozyma monospora]
MSLKPTNNRDGNIAGHYDEKRNFSILLNDTDDIKNVTNLPTKNPEECLNKTVLDTQMKFEQSKREAIESLLKKFREGKAPIWKDYGHGYKALVHSSDDSEDERTLLQLLKNRFKEI